MVGRADHQEWIVPRSIARCGLDNMSSSHQDPIRNPLPLDRSAVLSADTRRLRAAALHRSLPLAHRHSTHHPVAARRLRALLRHP